MICRMLLDLAWTWFSICTEEYKTIMDMFEADNVTYPIKAFFGELLERPRRTKAYPIALINKNINLDQLLAINNAMK